jgi:hypothetical protein
MKSVFAPVGGSAGGLCALGRLWTSWLPPKADDINAENITPDIADDPDLRTAYCHLKVALADPCMREIILNTLRGLTRASVKCVERRG